MENTLRYYQQKYPNFYESLEDGGFFGFDTHLETLGGRVLCYLADKAIQFDNETNRYKKAIKEFVCAYTTGFILLPAFIELAIETPIRKITGITRFK